MSMITRTRSEVTYNKLYTYKCMHMNEHFLPPAQFIHYIQSTEYTEYGVVHIVHIIHFTEMPRSARDFPDPSLTYHGIYTYSVYILYTSTSTYLFQYPVRREYIGYEYKDTGGSGRQYSFFFGLVETQVTVVYIIPCHDMPCCCPCTEYTDETTNLQKTSHLALHCICNMDCALHSQPLLPFPPLVLYPDCRRLLQTTMYRLRSISTRLGSQ